MVSDSDSDTESDTHSDTELLWGAGYDGVSFLRQDLEDPPCIEATD